MEVFLRMGNMCGTTEVPPCSTLRRLHLHGSMVAWQILGWPYWICRLRSGGFWGKTKVLRISRLWLVQTASGSTVSAACWKHLVQDGSRPRYLSKRELEGSVNTTSRQLDAVYFRSCMCLLYTTKLDQSRQGPSEAMIHDEDPTWVAIVCNSRRSVFPRIAEQPQRRGPPKNSWGVQGVQTLTDVVRGADLDVPCPCVTDARLWNEMNECSIQLLQTVYLRCHPFQQTLRPGTRRPSNITRTMKVQSTKKRKKIMKALGLTTWVSLWSLCVVASGLPGWDIGFMKWGRDGVGERWDPTDGHAHDVTLGKTGGASPKYAEYDIAPKNWTCFAWDKPAPLLFLTFALQYILLLWNGMPCQDDAIALSILADFHSRDVACHEEAPACKADNTFCQWFRATC